MIQDNLRRIQRSIPIDVVMVAVSKFQPSEAIIEAYDIGQRVFGESRPQELLSKYNQLPKDIEWHMIGHLQTNKVKLIAPFIALVESVDSLRLAEAINAEAHRLERVIDVLLEVHVAQEETKSGFDAAELERLLKDGVLGSMRNMRVRGVMGMASLTTDKTLIREEFTTLRSIFDHIKAQYLPHVDVLSMGMSADYHTAIECGSTMIRIGSSIFADR